MMLLNENSSRVKLLGILISSVREVERMQICFEKEDRAILGKFIGECGEVISHFSRDKLNETKSKRNSNRSTRAKSINNLVKIQKAG